MATVTLAQSALLTQDDLVTGVIENIIDVDVMFEIFPFDGVEGNALAYNRENVLGAVATTGVDAGDGVIGAGASGTNSTERLAAKDAATFTQVTSSLTTIMGDAEVNGLIQSTRSGQTDQTAIQIASKAKSAARKYRNMLINGDGTNFTFPGLISLVAGAQTVNNGANGAALSFAHLDELTDLVTDKDSQVDFIMMPDRTVRSLKALLRALGGANINETLELPSGKKVMMYSSIPVFRNQFIPVNQVKGASGAVCTTVFAGTLDDGSRTHGLAGLTSANDAGIMVEDVGISETKDEHIWRVKWYCGLANFSEKGLAALPGVTN